LLSEAGAPGLRTPSHQPYLINEQLNNAKAENKQVREVISYAPAWTWSEMDVDLNVKGNGLERNAP